MLWFLSGLISIAAVISFFYIAYKIGQLANIQKQQTNIQQHSFYFQIMPLDLPEDYIKRLSEQGVISKTMGNELLKMKTKDTPNEYWRIIGLGGTEGVR